MILVPLLYASKRAHRHFSFNKFPARKISHMFRPFLPQFCTGEKVKNLASIFDARCTWIALVSKQSNISLWTVKEFRERQYTVYVLLKFSMVIRCTCHENRCLIGITEKRAEKICWIVSNSAYMCADRFCWNVVAWCMYVLNKSTYLLTYLLCVRGTCFVIKAEIDWRDGRPPVAVQR